MSLVPSTRTRRRSTSSAQKTLILPSRQATMPASWSTLNTRECRCARQMPACAAAPAKRHSGPHHPTMWHSPHRASAFIERLSQLAQM